ncbi:MAG: precorrin-6A reductase [Vibrio sp.]
MSNKKLLVFGGTNNSVTLCETLDQYTHSYTLSVASEAGEQMSQHLAGEVICGRMDTNEMIHYLRDHYINMIIDCSHAHSDILHHNILCAAQELGIPVIRFEPPVETVYDPMVVNVRSVSEACQHVAASMKTVLLTTGTKELDVFCESLVDKRLVARIMPTSEVMKYCESQGLGIDNLVAMRGPFSIEFNRALYERIEPDVVITKQCAESGSFLDTVRPCVEMGIPCIVIAKPKLAAEPDYSKVLESIEDAETLFAEWSNTED